MYQVQRHTTGHRGKTAVFLSRRTHFWGSTAQKARSPRSPRISAVFLGRRTQPGFHRQKSTPPTASQRSAAFFQSPPPCTLHRRRTCLRLSSSSPPPFFTLSASSAPPPRTLRRRTRRHRAPCAVAAPNTKPSALRRAHHAAHSAQKRVKSPTGFGRLLHLGVQFVKIEKIENQEKQAPAKKPVFLTKILWTSLSNLEIPFWRPRDLSHTFDPSRVCVIQLTAAHKFCTSSLLPVYTSLS